MAQLRVVSVPRPILLAAGLVIGSLDEKGFFQGDLSSLGDGYGLSEEDLEKGLELVQTFDPPGIGARNICEALLIQTRRRSDGPPKTEELLTRHYDDFLRGKWSKIQQGLELSDKDLRDIRDFFEDFVPSAPARSSRMKSTSGLMSKSILTRAEHCLSAGWKSFPTSIFVTIYMPSMEPER